MNNLTITRRLKNAKSKIFKPFYTKKDFENKLKKLKELDESENLSARTSIIADIVKMFKCIGVECRKNESYEYYSRLINTVKMSEPGDLELEILKALYSNFEDYPTPSEYMQIMVNKLSDPEDADWINDSLRLRILKQFIKYCDYLKAVPYGGETYIKKYAKDKYEHKNKKELKAELEPLHKSKEYSETKEEIKNIRAELKQLSEVEESRKKELDGELKRLKKQLKTMEEVFLVLKYLDDQIFDKYYEELKTNKSKELRKPRGKFGLLRLADDLASGHFKPDGATKKELYLFAIAFKMSYYCGDEEEIIDYDSDIEKNLFEKYYNNNLMRFIGQKDEEANKNTEYDPSGQGINYKNFAEMIFIYYISKSYRDYSRSEKIRLACEMIDDVEKNFSKKDWVAPYESNPTVNYKDMFAEEILKKSESEFKDFILKNYNCDVRIFKNEMQMEINQETAYAVYREKLEEIDVKNSNYGIWFTDVVKLGINKNNGETGEEREKYTELYDLIGNKEADKEKEKEKIRAFVSLLENINMYLKKRITDVNDPESITRTALMTAYYYYYNEKYESLEIQRTLTEVYEDYTNNEIGLNSMLDEAHYQPISDKNIFDIVLIFSSYAYLSGKL